MVRIEYYPDPTVKDCEIYDYTKLSDFLIEKEFSRNELLDLRYFKSDMLGEELDTSDVRFLDFTDGVVCITHDSKIPEGPFTPFIPYIIAAAVVSFAVAILITPDVEVPDAGNRKQSSSTNSLGEPENGPRVNERIDDVFGTVTKHTPPLWQVPYRVGVNNQETEIMLLCIGRGKYELNLDRVFDGDTPYRRIPDAKFSKYEPGTYPGNGVPSEQIGSDITDKIGIYRVSNDLNSAELVPPNDLASENVTWVLSSTDGNTGVIKAVTKPDDWKASNYYVNGDSVRFNEVRVDSGVVSSVELWRSVGIVLPVSQFFDIHGIPHNLGSGGNTIYDYTVISSDDETVTLDLTALPQSVRDIWNGLNEEPTIEEYYVMTFPSSGASSITLNSEITTDDWYEEEDLINLVGVTTEIYDAFIGLSFDERIGPIVGKKGATEVILNFVSTSGFLKLVSNNETSIEANINILVEELDDNGDPTGNSFDRDFPYSTNPERPRSGVYQTDRFETLYDNWQLTCKRTTNRDKGSTVSNIDKIEWRTMFTFEPIDSNHDFGDVTLAHVSVTSNSESQLTKKRKTNLDVTRKITQYLGNGVFGPTEDYATDKFDQILIHTALDVWCGRLNLDQVNADGLLLLKQQVEEYFGSDEMCRFGYDFDDTQLSYEDMFTIISNVVNVIPYAQNGVYDAFFERKQDTSSLQITHRNKISESESREDVFFKKYDGVEFTYRDEETSLSETIYIPTDRSSTNPERIEMPGCTTRLQAYRRALRQYNKQRYNVTNVSFDVDEFGRMVVPGQRIDSPDGTRFVRHEGNTDGYRVYDGEVIEVKGLTVELSQPVTFFEGEDHYVQFTNLEGENSEPILVLPGDDEFEIVLTSTPVEPVYDGYSRDRTKFTFCSEQLRESIALIPQTIEFTLDDGKEINTISSINYDSRYYQGDLETL